MKTTTLAAAAIIGASALTFIASDAQAAIACNAFGECWRVRTGFRFPAHAGIVVHPNSWRWRGAGRPIVWRTGRTGRGFWRRGVWVRF